MAIVLALGAALVFGVSDYIGGRASRRTSAIAVTLVAEASTFALLLVVVPLVSDATPRGTDVAWGMAAGVASTVGIVALYHALARGAMTVVAPLTGVMSAVVPVAVGLATGERPAVLALVGVGLAVVSVALIGGLVGVPHVRTPRTLVMVAILAGTAFGLLFVFFDRAGDDSEMWPLLAARGASVPLVAAALVASRRRSAVRIGRSVAMLALLIGVLSTAANLCYLLATRRGLLTIVAVVVAMYPATTVLLATVLDRERMRPPQIVGLTLAVVALALVTIGR